MSPEVRKGRTRSAASQLWGFSPEGGRDGTSDKELSQGEDRPDLRCRVALGPWEG